MAKVDTLPIITSGYHSTTQLNSAFEKITDAFLNTLSLDGSSPNEMNANLDMNSNRILNLPAPVSDFEPLRLIDISLFTYPVTSVFGRTGDVVAQSGDYSASQVTNAFDLSSNNSDSITEGSSNLFLTPTERTKLSGIEANADVTDGANVSSALSGFSLSSTTVASDDKVLLQDTSDSDELKYVTAQDIADLATGGSGDVVGPASATDNAVARFDSTTGKLLQNSDVTINDTGDISTTGIIGAGTASITGSIASGGGVTAGGNILGNGDCSISGEYTVFRGTSKELDVGDELIEITSTGLTSGGDISIGTPTTTYDVDAGTGHIVDPIADTYTSVSWSAATDITPAETDGTVYVYVDSSGTVSESSTELTDEERRDNIYLGRVAVVSGEVRVAQAEPAVVSQPTSQLYDLGYALRTFNVSGNVVSANGTNLSINKSAGVLFELGSNYQNNNKIPHKKSIGAYTPATFFRTTQTAPTAVDVTTIDPANYDNGGTLTAVGGGTGASQNLRVYLFSSGTVGVAYGQVTYSTLAQAIQGISTENPVLQESIANDALLIGIISVVKTATDLTDTSQARFFRVSRFGEVSIGGAGTSVSSLQNAYDNSSNPEILTNSTLGAVNIRRGSAADSDNVLTIQNNAGSNTFAIDGNGNIVDASSATFGGSITTGGTVNGRSMSADGAKLDGIEAGAEVNTVDSVNGETGVIVLDTDDITEGSTNLYYTETRFDTSLATKDTDDITEGSINLYNVVPDGGTASQVLAKASGTNYDLEWVDAGGGGGSSTLSGLTDTTITSPVNRNLLMYNGSTWINTTISVAAEDNGSGVGNVAIGTGSATGASASSSVSIGGSNTASSTGSVAIGGSNNITGVSSVGIGYANNSTADYGVAIGFDCDANFEGSVALGNAVSTTKANQYLFGGASSFVTVPGTLELTGETAGILQTDGSGTVSSSTVALSYLEQDGATDGQVLTWNNSGGVWEPQDAASGAVDSVNSQTGVVVLDADDIDDTSTTNKFTTASDISKLAGIEAGADVTDEANVVSALDGATLTGVTVAGDDKIVLQDTSDSDNIKTTTAQGIANLAPAQTESIMIAVSDETTDLTTGTAKITFRMPYAFTLSAVRASVTTAPTGSTLTVDINEGGSSILSTEITIDAGEKTSTTAATPPVISDANLADDAEITIDIDQVGSTIAGTGLKVSLIGVKA